MDQIQIGRFIAKTRKSLHLTQRQLADALSISDKTISKWETGKGLPEIALLLPLCHMLNISVNELLSAEKILPADYHKKAEENMANLMEKTGQKTKRQWRFPSFAAQFLSSPSLPLSRWQVFLSCLPLRALCSLLRPF